ncbi:cytochrome b [Pseudothioglobus sp. nBUS_23]|uniref:cytochrome b n=1 Tax=Pseudothioglobus sp. nBUS_23 TaxID=3395318 RepID=UPI003EB7793C
MNNTNLDSKSNFSSIAKFMHWGFVLLFIYGLLKQIDELNQLENKALLKFEVIFATVFVLLLLIRFIYMKTTQKSSLPDSTPKSQILAARVVHYGMYVCLTLIPLTGLLIGLLFWLGFEDGFLINTVVEVHEFSVSVIYWLIGLHILAAIFHRLKNDGVWSSMVPFLKEKSYEK